jgi:hypothetical protein
MRFRMSMRSDVEQKLNRLVEFAKAGMEAQEFWSDLSKVLQNLREKAPEMGEPVFDYKYGNYQCKLAVVEAIAVQFAVNEPSRSVLVQRITISGISPYPPEIEDVLNHESS